MRVAGQVHLRQFGQPRGVVLEAVDEITGLGRFEELPDLLVPTRPAELPKLPPGRDERETLLVPSLIDLIRRRVDGDQGRDQDAGIENDPHRLSVCADGLFDRLQSLLLGIRLVALLDVLYREIEQPCLDCLVSEAGDVALLAALAREIGAQGAISGLGHNNGPADIAQGKPSS